MTELKKKKKESLSEYTERYYADDQENQLTFVDGVLVTWKIYDKVLKNQLTDEKGEPEKDSKGCDYLGIINDNIDDLLFNQILEKGYFKNRGYQLMHQFGIDI